MIAQGNIKEMPLIMQAMHGCQALDYCKQQAQQQIQLAQQQLESITETPYRQALMDLTHFAIERVY